MLLGCVELSENVGNLVKQWGMQSLNDRQHHGHTAEESMRW